MRPITESERVFRFTNTRLENWPAPEREVYLHDTERPNLVCRVSAKGARTFYFYRKDETFKSRTAKVRIGVFPEWTVEQARDRVDVLNGATVNAGGVVPKRAATRPVGHSLGEAFDTYIAEHRANGGRTAEQYERWYRLYLLTHARTPMESIDREWVRTLLRSIVNAKVDAKRLKARRDGGRAVANSVLALLSTVYTHYLEETDKSGTRANPCIVPKGSKKKLKYAKRLRHLAMDEDEQTRFVNALDTYKREHAVYKITRKRLGWIKGAPIAKKADLADLLFIALVTGRRRGAIARMKWADLNLDTTKPTWTIPPEDNKAGTADTVTLHPEVARLIRERRKAGNKFVLPGALGGIDPKTGRHRLADPRKTFRAVLAIAEINNPRLVVHSLRATWITNGLRMKESTESIRHAVGHASISSTAGYAALLDDDKRRVSDAIGDAMLRGRRIADEEAA